MHVKVCYKPKENMVFELPVLYNNAEKDEEGIITSKCILTTEAFVIQSLQRSLPWAFQAEHPLRGFILIMQHS